MGSLQVEDDVILASVDLLINKPAEHETPALNHLAIIPDGNRRWARGQKMKPEKGHWAGADALSRILHAAVDTGIHTITIWVMSPSNFKRSKVEFDNLCEIMRNVYEECRSISNDHDARIAFIGYRKRLPSDILKIIETAEADTKERTKHRFNFALDYGGREEIVECFNKLQISESHTRISEKQISESLWGGNQPFPDPDLIIRTGSKDAKTFRTSGFMTWQSVNAEFYFEDKYMPEVEEEDLKKWIEAYKGTEKRLGL